MTSTIRFQSMTVDRPRVSVVVPCYNSAWVIEDTLRTIRAQDFEDFELIVINDGSTDDIATVMAPHLAADARVRVFNQENRGLAGARNRGLAEARGDYVAFIDADDIWHPSFLRRAVERLDKSPGAPFAFAYSFRFDDENAYFGPSLWGKAPRHDLVGMATVNLVGNGSAAVFRRDLVTSVGGFDETMRERGAHGAEDWKLCLMLTRMGTPELIEESLVGYRMVAGGMSQGDPRRQMRAVEMVISDLKSAFPELPRKVWKDAKVTMNGWLLPGYLRKGLYREALGLMIESYVTNPGWFRSPLLRRLHAMRVQMAVLGIREHLFGMGKIKIDELREPDGSRPFAILEDIVRKRRSKTIA